MIRVPCRELVGYGEGIDAGRGRDISVAAQAEYLAGWLEQLGVRRAVFLGHDLGGGIARSWPCAGPRWSAASS